MTGTTITALHARQILDSRGRPTVEVELTLANGLTARASTPSGASTGKAEALELRDGGDAWEGRGVGAAVANVCSVIAPLVIGRDARDQAELDAAMRTADGTPNLARLGANATLPVSIAAVRAAALADGQPLWRRFADLAGTTPTMPLPMVNILSGGLHAGRGMDVQDFLAVPVGASSYDEALDWICRVRTAAATICAERALPTLLADEGGLSPGFADSEAALDLLVAAIDRAGLAPGRQVAVTLDVAAASLTGDDGRYVFARQQRRYTADELIALLERWAGRYPIISIEDGLGEEDWSGWRTLTARLGRIQLVVDDLFATQPDRIARGIADGVANAVLIKVNQNGTISGTLDAIRVARAARYAIVVSARSGETEDDFLADLAVGAGGGQIKVGSVRNSERMAKYNQLLRIDEAGLPWAGTSGLAPL